MERITIVLRPGLGLNFEAMRPALQAGAAVAIGRGGAVIESVLDEDHPADEALKPGIFDVITGTACITGDGSGEALPPLEEHLAQVENVGDALRDEHLRANQVTESLGILERWIEKAEHTDGYVGVVEIEAVEIVADELRRLRQATHPVACKYNHWFAGDSAEASFIREHGVCHDCAEVDKQLSPEPDLPTEDELEAAELSYPLSKEEAVALWNDRSGWRRLFNEAGNALKNAQADRNSARRTAEYWKAEHVAANSALDAAQARLAELEKQEPVATVAKVPGEDWNSLDFHRDLQGIQPGTKLYAAQAGQVPAAWLDVQAERRRQIETEGWTPEHDDEHGSGQMARAAACYALAGSCAPNDETAALLVSLAWPWAPEWWKPTETRRDLVKSAALILAELERLDRAAAPQPAGGE